MNYVKDKRSYLEWEKLDKVYSILNSILTTDEKRFDPYLVNLAQSEPYPDLTDVHPKDRKNLEVYALEIFNKDGSTDSSIISLLDGAYEIVKSMIGVHTASLFFHAPNTWIPPHVHDTTRPEYDESTEYNIYLPLVVPSIDTKKVGTRIGNYVYPLKETDALIFDHQIPHDSWNYTDARCMGMVFSFDKKYFTDIPYENYNT